MIMIRSVIYLIDEEKGRVTTDLLSVRSCNGSSTGENIFNILDKELKDNNISWNNCVSFACENANVMIGIHKGVGAFIHKENESIYLNCCPCHLLHLTAKSANKELSIDIEEQLMDIYFYLDKSSKRKKKNLNNLNLNMGLSCIKSLSMHLLDSYLFMHVLKGCLNNGSLSILLK